MHGSLDELLADDALAEQALAEAEAEGADGLDDAFVYEWQARVCFRVRSNV